MKLILDQACVELSRGVFKCRRVPHNMSNQSQMHWSLRKKWTDAWHAAVLVAVDEATQKGQKRPKLPAKMRVDINLYKHQLFDTDGAYNAIKPVLDGLKHANIIIDDAPKYIDLEVKQIKVKSRKEEKVEIEITKK